ncbi:MAG: transcription-repair coupling factor [Hyphomicrobiaceae bacterium]
MTAAAKSRPAAGPEVLTGVPEGYDGFVLAQLAAETSARLGSPQAILHIARDDRRLGELEAALAFFSAKTKVIALPAWDTVPYDRIGPNSEIVAKRITSLAMLAAGSRKEPTVVLTTVNAVLQRLPPRDFIKRALKQIAPGQRIDRAELIDRLMRAGFVRTGTVMEPGEYAVRGSLIDLFPPGRQTPVRLDFFDDTLEAIKSFDIETQRTAKVVQRLLLTPMSEVAFGEHGTSRFRQAYIAAFGANKEGDPLYEAVSAGHRYPGVEHWLPLFHDRMETLLDYLPEAPVSLDHMAGGAIADRLMQIKEHYEARVDALEATKFGAPPYKPLPPERLYISEGEWQRLLNAREWRLLTPFDQGDDASPGASVRAFRGRSGGNFATERTAEGGDLFGAVVARIKQLMGQGKRVIVAAWTIGARERLTTLLTEHGLADLRRIESYDEALTIPATTPMLAVLGLEEGFETPDLAVIGEQDILGDRLVRPRRKSRRAADVITEATSLSVGDLVVHADHGIGRFVGLQTITALGEPHDCLELHYHGGDKLYLPVENIDLLSRYGSDETTAELDRLGSLAWQGRKSRLKKRLREIAGELIKIAALRQLREAPILAPPAGAFDEFVARFPYEATEDQASSIDAVIEDLGSGRPMDRLVCGDVGFGKTEVALRAAFIAAMAGLQVAVVVPTTLLARQHYKTFSTRFQGLPLRLGRASRMVPTKELAEVKTGMKDGTIDIVVGTHALLSKTVDFARLGLLIIDEEQHFGVGHKERLKQLKEEVHVLTLTATPIPRTLQLALSGVRELSLITTPPVDRLAVRTYISPLDPVILREALRRERHRGGQTFYVVPRIADLDDVGEFLAEHTPELKVARAHGQLAPTELEDVMTAFYEGQYDVLLSTAIVESGLDIPNANTLIVHRADMFGLAQLYQLRGRVGRSKIRAYAYFTTPVGQKLTEGAEKRLKVLQSLDTLGAGFSLASHDLDIRGAGNLLGDEQSGHIREVGFELYQSMLEETIASLKGGDLEAANEQWSPQIQLGTPVLLPESYIADLQVRLGLYRRLSNLKTREEIDNFGAELVDRFGMLPPEVEHLLDVVEIKALCRRASVASLDAGPRGASIVFRKGQFTNPDGLVKMIAASKGMVKVQPDMKLVFRAEWDSANARLKGARGLVAELARLADAA